jgi:hypothetical protein
MIPTAAKFYIAIVCVCVCPPTFHGVFDSPFKPFRVEFPLKSLRSSHQSLSLDVALDITRDFQINFHTFPSKIVMESNSHKFPHASIDECLIEIKKKSQTNT